MNALYPLGYSGYGGVAIIGAQVVSALVAGLPSVSARLIAVIGRHRPWTYFACQTEISAPATLMSIAANIRAAPAMSLIGLGVEGEEGMEAGATAGAEQAAAEGINVFGGLVSAWHQAGHSQRTIARELNIDRRKVKRLIDQAG